MLLYKGGKPTKQTTTMVSDRPLVLGVPTERRDEFWWIRTFRGAIKWPSCFPIVSALALEVPAFLQNIENLRGVSPDIQLSCEPWGHGDHSGGGGGVNASSPIVQVLMFMACPPCQRSVYLCRNWRTPQTLPGEVVHR